MCGITIYHGVPTELQNMWDTMLQMKHRGNEDGFGYIDLDNKNIVKSTLSFKEIETEIINDKIKHTESLKKDFEKRVKEIKDGLLIKTGFAILHNRKASVGQVKLENTHPIKIRNGVYYIHNGSVDGTELLKNWLSISKGVKFKTQTDSELLGYLVEEQISRNTNHDDILSVLNTLCPNGFGVLVRIDIRTKEIIVLKDTERTLYIYKNTNGILLTSEPLVIMKKFDICYRLEKGIIRINDNIDMTKCFGYNVTERLKNAIIKDNRTYNCDICKSKGETINYVDNKDVCLVCLTSDVDVEKSLNKTTVSTQSTTNIPISNYTKETYDPKRWYY